MSALGLWRTARMFARVAGRLPPAHLWYLLRRMNDEHPHRFAGQTRINSFFPPWPSPSFDRFCEAVIARRRVPYSVYVAVTGRCPCRCAHCSYAGRKAAEPATEALLELVGSIRDLGSCIVGFTGGEPLVRPDLERLVAACRPGLATILFTTGSGLDSRRARSLAAAGLGNVTIGLEAAQAAAHDAVRGLPGSFEQARQAAFACREAGLYLSLSTVGAREKVASGELERLHALAREWGAGELRVLSPVATGGLAGNPAAMLDGEERRALCEFHRTANRGTHGPAVACSAHLESEQLFGCGAGYHHLYVDAAGEVCPCDLTPLSFGNAFAEPLPGIWERMARYFPAPRCECAMARLAGSLASGERLPLPRERSERLCAALPADGRLPQGYRRLLTSRKP